MSYVIKRTNDGAYVAPAGEKASYTGYLDRARTFATREEAEREKCGNEVVADVNDCLRRAR